MAVQQREQQLQTQHHRACLQPMTTPDLQPPQQQRVSLPYACQAAAHESADPLEEHRCGHALQISNCWCSKLGRWRQTPSHACR